MPVMNEIWKKEKQGRLLQKKLLPDMAVTDFFLTAARLAEFAHENNPNADIRQIL